MKLQKKFSVSCLNFILDYLAHGYYPVDDNVNESQLISKIFGFGLYQGLIEDEAIRWDIQRIELPEPKKTARLDITDEEASAILDMMSEAFREIDETNDYKRLKTYLTKEFVHADNTENSEQRTDS